MKISSHLVAGTVLALGGLLSAQASYTAFGQGCSGTGSGSFCAAANGTATAHQNRSHNQNIFALGVPPVSYTRVVIGFELLTQVNNRTTPLTISTQIFYADSAGKPTGKPVATGTMTIGTKAGWYRTTLGKLLIVPANQKFFLSYTSASGQMYFPFASTGANTSHFWHSPTATSWNGSAPNGFITQRWAWRVVCAGSSNLPILSATGIPSLNKTFSVDLVNGRANSPAIFAIGLSNTTWNKITLPWDLAVVGAVGCNLYVSLDAELPVKTDANGNVTLQLTVPNDTNLMGFKFYNQFGVIDAGANALGVAFSNGGAGVVN